jgi:hypothetical protein
MYLTAWAITRGNEALEFFSASMAPELNPVDGWGTPDTTATASNSGSTTPQSKRARVEDSNDFGLLCAALADTAKTSPSKREYYTQKVKSLRLQNETAAVRGSLELERERVNVEREQLSLKRSELETTGLKASTVEQCMTSAVNLWKNVKALQDMGADEETMKTAKSLARKAVARANMLDSGIEGADS